MAWWTGSPPTYASCKLTSVGTSIWSHSSSQNYNFCFYNCHHLIIITNNGLSRRVLMLCPPESTALPFVTWLAYIPEKKYYNYRSSRYEYWREMRLRSRLLQRLVSELFLPSSSLSCMQCFGSFRVSIAISNHDLLSAMSSWRGGEHSVECATVTDKESAEHYQRPGTVHSEGPCHCQWR